MKKSLIKIWSIGLVVALLVSLLVMAAPASAAPLMFRPATVPSTTNLVLADGSAGVNVTDIAVGSDGVIYAACGTENITKTVNGGIGWSPINTAAGGTTLINVSFVAVAPDDNNVVAIANAGGTVYYSSNGGNTWADLGKPTATVGDTDPCDDVKDLAVSATADGSHYIAVAGNDTNNHGNVWYLELKAGGAWKSTNRRAGFQTTASTGYGSANNTLAVEFSPNFSSDKVLAAVTYTDNASRGLSLELLSLSVPNGIWNNAAALGQNYPVQIQKDGTTAITDPTAASIALAPTYLGWDEVERVAFVGVTAGTDAVAGIYRLKDDDDKDIKTGVDIYSIAYDGTNLVAGESGTTTVWRCDEPLASTPTFYGSSDTKEPGGANLTLVAWNGTDVVAGTSGTNSAFAVSKDNGKSFNDISLMSTSIKNYEDVAVSPDGSVKYILTDDDSSAISLFRSKGPTWERVLSLTDTNHYIIRINPANPDVVYVARPGAYTVYYSSKGGDDKWYTRTSRYTIQDLAVESDDVAYVATGKTISKTTNSGFTWSAGKNTEVVGGDVYSITVLAEDQLLVGSTTGYVSYSTDGNSSWNRILQQISSTSTKTVVAASGVANGNYIYAGTQADDVIKRWTIGQPQTAPWKDLEAPTATAHKAYGIALVGDALYVCTANTGASRILRTLNPTAAAPGSQFWSQITDISPQGPFNNPVDEAGDDKSVTEMRIGGSTIYCVNADTPAPTTTDDALLEYTDTLIAAGPTAIGPADGTQIKINPISGLAYDVSFTWKRPSDATIYQLWIAFDPAFDEVAINVITSSTELATVSQIVGPSGTTSTTPGAGNKLDYMPGTTYYWKVRVAQGGPTYSPWSEIRTFTVEPGSAVVPIIASPQNGATNVSATPAFSWSPVSGATEYEFQLSAETTFASPMVTVQLASTGIQPTVKLDPGKIYFWRVRALEPIQGGWSTISNFTVAVPAPPPAKPVEIKEVPAPVINIPAPPPAQEIVIPPAPTPPAPIAPGYIWAVIIIGAILVIAVIVLIVRTRRTV